MKKYLLGLALSSALSLFASTEKSQPNIVVIYADDMGYGDLACQNSESKLKTPNLDKLASEGIRFTDGHSSSGICTPSRYALLTGNYHWRRMHGIVGSFGDSVFEENEMTLPRMLKSKGYKTAAIGKWHLGFDWKSIQNKNVEAVKLGKKKAFSADAFDWSKPIGKGPLSIGFDTYFGDGVINFPPYCWVENDRVLEAPTEMLNLGGSKPLEGNWECRPGPAVKDWDIYDVLPTLTKRAVSFINEQKPDEAFFLYFALSAPHAPIIPNEEFRGKTQAGSYGDFVFQVDWVTGQVLDALDKKGLSDNTIVIFTADNGPEHYAYSRMTETGHVSTGDLRGLKRDIYEGGHRVPFIIRWPGKVQAGSVSNEVVSQVDLMSTLAEVTGGELSNEVAVDSYDISPVLFGKDYKSPLREATVQNTKPEKYAIRRGNWVYLNTSTGHHSNVSPKLLDSKGFHPIDKKAKGLLYNLKDDLGQRKNVYDQHPEIVQELSALLKKYREQGRSINR